ncbi:MAG: O-acetylhomoserine aminocarboxypropyltransferase/cysteine synthase [Firmicutes bacterium]|nr:O-acetylhomoserine aminocarboxypropyltransferase/cysteine synthase [[Eubacterium] siraeum]MCM1487163.1 O-acetylhomoserine aminocarboxypropyltransferase/cysteine synthase [Bacillota bacterium]
MSDYRFDTKVIHSGYETDPATHSVVPPVCLTNAYVFDNAEHARKLFSLEEAGNIYSRLGNPTCDVLEKRIAELDGGAGALGFSSGHAAIFNTVINLCSQGDEIVSSANIYGGAINLLGVTLDRLGIKVTFVDPDDLSAWERAITPKTKMLFTEVVGNPNANVSDLSAIAELAHKNGIPFAVDSTFTTPYLCRPIEHGADIVIHSATKYLSGHGSVMAGIVVDSGKFDFKGNPRFPLYNEPDASYHGLVFAELGAAAFITRLRALVTRDLGACLSPFNAYITLLGVETLPLRMDRHCENALACAEFLQQRPEVESVSCPMLKNSKYYGLAQRYAPKGTGGVFTFELKGGREAGRKFMDSMKLLKTVANVGDVRSMVIHPATTTHSQLSPEQLRAGGITENTVRLSIGLEDKQDIIADLEQALKASGE